MVRPVQSVEQEMIQDCGKLKETRRARENPYKPPTTWSQQIWQWRIEADMYAMHVMGNIKSEDAPMKDMFFNMLPKWGARRITPGSMHGNRTAGGSSQMS